MCESMGYGYGYEYGHGHEVEHFVFLGFLGVMREGLPNDVYPLHLLVFDV